MNAAERREAAIKEIVDNWPPLTPRQLDQVSVLLWPDRTTPGHHCADHRSIAMRTP